MTNTQKRAWSLSRDPFLNFWVSFRPVIGNDEARHFKRDILIEIERALPVYARLSQSFLNLRNGKSYIYRILCLPFAFSPSAVVNYLHVC